MIDPNIDPQGYFNAYLSRCDYEKNFINNYLDIKGTNTEISGHLETRARKGDVTEVLRFRIHDPLWTLSRQWQLGEFRGNDAGTAMSVRCHVASTPISAYGLGANAESRVSGLSVETPIEPVVEQINREITPLVRVESAAFFCSLIKWLPQKNYDVAMEQLKRDYPLAGVMVDERSSLEHDEIRAVTAEKNTRLQRFSRAFASKAFDGYALYQDLLKTGSPKGGVDAFKGSLKMYAETRTKYLDWFTKRYLPKGEKKGAAWNLQKLGYDFSAENAVAKYKADDYAGGRVSWYSFDVNSMRDGKAALQKNNYVRKNVDRQTIDSIPVLASYPGAPNKRLWQFENKRVFMGNSKDMQAKGNVAFMQFATMYGNDWMLCPLKTEIGKYIEVESIEVYDTFGIRSDIVKRAGMDEEKDGKTFGQRWQMFTNTPVEQDDYDNLTDKGKQHYANGLMFPPSLVRTQEGESLEEVSLLRDEMANMVWGVETRIEDGCGSSLDAKMLAADVEQYMEDKYDEQVEKVSMKVKNVQVGNGTETEVESGYQSDYKYSLMTSVPLNWIPFVPQHLNSKEERAKYEGFQGGRETILRRGKMPYFFDGAYRPVRPLSSILKVETTQKSNEVFRVGVGSKLEVKETTNGLPIFGRLPTVAKVIEKPLFINEEQVQGVGTVIRKNCQRSRWLDGRTFTWMGYSKEIKHTQGVSGLEFDNLLDPTR